MLYDKGLICYQFNFINSRPMLDNGNELGNNFECMARIRHRQELQKAFCQIDNEKVIVTFEKPQRAVAEGQYVVLYVDNVCLGGGVIEEKF